ncbi:MAG TPA: hypothetical protein VFA10_27090 [Ktedonobacteraceae bacterium]|nr:hypothetical protein [Ktedonobacteraceae bacterium]
MTVKNSALKEEQRKLLLEVVELEMVYKELLPHLREVAYFLHTLIESSPELFPMSLDGVKEEHLSTHPYLLSMDDKVRIAAAYAKGELSDVQSTAQNILKILDKYVK